MKMADTTTLIRKDISFEEWREYEFCGRIYRINDPQILYYHHKGTCHRIVDSNGVAHCIPAPGEFGCVLRWKSKDSKKPVGF